MNEAVTWNLDSFFPKFQGPEMIEFKADLKKKIQNLQSEISQLAPLSANNFEAWEKCILDLEDLSKYASHFFSYIGCLTADDANNEEYQRESSEMATLGAEFEKLGINLDLGFIEVSDEDFSNFLKREKLKDIHLMLKESRARAKTSMTKELENLNAELGVVGYSAWERLYFTLSGKLSFNMLWPDGKEEEIPMAQCRSLMQNPDREVRKNAFERGNKAWENISDICAQALNSIAGTRLTINKKRGIENFLDQSLKESRISQKSLDAMFKAIEENADFARKLGFAKAEIMGLNGLTWYDFEAPVEIPGLEKYSWEKAVKLVDNAFSQSIPELGEFFRMAIDKRWVEAEPRNGKMPGAFCTGSYLTEESRVFMTHSGSLGDVSTLAHEIGHAFHSHLMKGMRPNLKNYPMTLAEAASTFGEMLLADGILNDPEISDAQKLNILTQELNHGMAFLIDIPIRFMFEKSFYEERKKSEVSVARLKELMSNAMKEKFGNLLIDNGEDPFFWASKMHFYLTDASFYNYPYSFGYLLSRGLYTMFKQDREAFLPKYREFLRRSGSDYAHIVAQETIGADLEDTAFWTASILSHEPELKLFKELAKKVLK